MLRKYMKMLHSDRNGIGNVSGTDVESCDLQMGNTTGTATSTTGTTGTTTPTTTAINNNTNTTNNNECFANLNLGLLLRWECALVRMHKYSEISVAAKDAFAIQWRDFVSNHVYIYIYMYVYVYIV